LLNAKTLLRDFFSAPATACGQGAALAVTS
jgi:hypothetical protein